MKNNVNNTESKLYETKLLSILISNSNEINQYNDIKTAISNNQTIVNFNACETFLKTNGYLAKNETISYSKIDWDSLIKSNNTINTTNTPSMSFDLYSNNGTQIDKNLCANIPTEVLIPIEGFNDEMRNNLTKNGYELFNPNSTYFNDICIPMKLNDTAVVMEDRSGEFNTANLKCSTGCRYNSINLTIGYISCLCDTNQKDEIGTTYGKLLLDIFKQVNIEIIKCWQTILKYVSCIYLKISLTFFIAMDLSKI